MSLFWFTGTIRRLPYAVSALAAFFSQHVAVALLFWATHRPLALDAWFWLAPLRMIATIQTASAVTLLAALAVLLLVAWVLAGLSFRRAADAGVSEWIAAYAIAPVVQIPAILFLCVMPSRREPDREAPEFGADAPVSRVAAAQGLLAGTAVTLFAVAVSALVFGSYGIGVFVASPFVVGALTAYFANHRSQLDGSKTAGLVVFATVLGGVALVVTALEGAVCIVMAAPLGIGIALVGGVLGRAIAVRTRRSPAQTLSGVALLPLLFALEAVMPPMTSFDTTEAIRIDAPPDRVWQAILHMARIDVPLALPFRLGVAYPLGGEIVGDGVGAIRHGEFSTGTALERVTEWEVNKKLAFTVLNDIPAMRELSPYTHVHAPHVIGYFRTTTTSFELVPAGGGGTEIVERTSHQLRLDPVFYWLPLARWIVHENNDRVLTHIKRQAEGASRGG